jgi:hypothetical protein
MRKVFYSKWFFPLALAVGMFLGGYLRPVRGQNVVPGSTPVQQVQPLLSCTPVNGTAASGSQATLTIQAPGNGQFIYVWEIDIEDQASTAATAASDVYTTTNLNSVQWVLSNGATAGVNGAVFSMAFPMPLKAAAAGTKVTIVGPAGVAGNLQNINACYSYGS